MTEEADRPHGFARRETAPHFVLFSGGSACRAINIALSRMSARVTRIVPAWDSGGSSKKLREGFGVPPVGDVRQALMTMAHGEGRASSVVRICNARLSDALGNDDAEAEFRFIASGKHPLLLRMAPSMREVILAYLAIFQERLPTGFDFRNGSIGNFILTGAYFAHGEDINLAISRFRELCAIEGNVWPASPLSDLQLYAILRDHRRLERQHLVTTMNEADSAIGIETIGLSSQAGEITANERTLEEIGAADAIIFGPGSFYTSILPHLMLNGVQEAISGNTRAPRIFLANILECTETRGMTAADHVRTFVAAMDPVAGQLLTHVISNTELFPFEKTVGRFPYLREGPLDRLCEQLAIRHISDDLEDAWTRGVHDGAAVATLLASIAIESGETRPCNEDSVSA
ncbi:MAG: YvcK family protein [Rhizobiaceae bacterium]